MTATTVAASRPQSNKQSLWRRFVKGRGLSYCVLAVIGVFWIFPFLWMIRTAFSTTRSLPSDPNSLRGQAVNFDTWNEYEDYLYQSARDSGVYADEGKIRTAVQNKLRDFHGGLVDRSL